MICNVANEKCYTDKTAPKIMRPIPKNADEQKVCILTYKDSLIKSFKEYSTKEYDVMDVDPEDQLY